MQREPVASSDIESVGYDEQSKVLEIEFKSGGIYQYPNVPKNIFSGLMSADSKGRYFHKHIRDQYKAARVE